MTTLQTPSLQIREFLTREMGLDSSLADEDPLFSSGLLDSIDLLSILEFIESQWTVTFSAFDVGLEDMDSIGRIVRQIQIRSG
jgi:acyl carrier protein